ncbi:MAG TPA: hypothetical protein VGT98_08455, partial [Candidatus Elarobacter sp.]|nr:hypothetical protein [Candidatus Elarobacter sp.]
QYLRRIALPVPPLAEQRRIVAALEEHLSDLDAAVAGLERAKANAGHLRTAALRRVFQDRHDPVERFEAVIESLRNGISTKPEGDAGLRILRISAVRPMRVDLHEVRFLPESADAYRDHLLVEGDLLFTRYNGNPGLVGACGMVGALAEATVYPDKLIRARVRRGRLDPRFAQIALSVGVSRAFIQSKVKTTAGQAGIAGADIKNVPIPLPDLKDQYAIIAEVEQRLTSVARLRAEIDVQLARAARLRQAILRRAFEGKLVARAPNDEPARELVSHGSATRDGVARPQQSRMRPRGSTR